MKNEVMKTKEMVEVTHCEHNHSYGKQMSPDKYRLLMKYFYSELELVSENIDWEQRRFELAKSAMQGMLSNQFSWGMTANDRDDIATEAIRCADAVIAKLKEE